MISSEGFVCACVRVCVCCVCVCTRAWACAGHVDERVGEDFAIVTAIAVGMQCSGWFEQICEQVPTCTLTFLHTQSNPHINHPYLQGMMAHSRYGTYLLDDGGAPMITHLDGKR